MICDVNGIQDSLLVAQPHVGVTLASQGLQAVASAIPSTVQGHIPTMGYGQHVHHVDVDPLQDLHDPG